MRLQETNATDRDNVQFAERTFEIVSHESGLVSATSARLEYLESTEQARNAGRVSREAT